MTSQPPSTSDGSNEMVVMSQPSGNGAQPILPPGDERSGPVRVRLSRAKGWKMPPNTLKVDRSTMWGNPYRAGDIHPYANSEDLADPARVEELRIDAETAVALYGLGCATANMLSNHNPFAVLRGKNLACWCALDAPCHANVLLELANAPAASDTSSATDPLRDADT